MAAGEVVFDSRAAAGVLDRLTGRVKTAGASLTAREQETLVLLADGAGTDQISTRLGVARNTARNHVQRVARQARRALEARGRVHRPS